MKDKSVEGHGTCEIRHQQPPLPPSPPNEDTRSPSPSPPQTASALLPTATPRSRSPSPLLEPSNTSSASATATATASKGELLRRLSRGTTMIKFPNKLARRPEERRVRLVGLQNLDDNMLDPSDTLDAASSASAESNLGAVVGVGWESKNGKKILKLNPANFHAIREIRLGQNTKAFELHGKNPDVEERAFSIIYVAEGKYKMLNLVAPSKEECALWVAGLHMLLANMSVIVDTPATPLMSNPIPESMHSWLHRMWNDADPSQSGKLGLDSVTALMGRLNVRLSKLEVKSALKNSGITKHSFLVFEDFERLYRTLRFRPEIGELFSSLAKIDPSGLTYEEFEHFMIHTQKNKDISRSRCLDIYKKYLGTSHPSNRSSSDTQTHILSLMDMDHFSAFLLSANNPVFRKSNATSVYHDMTRPLTDYIINSSHNTYLLGDQLAGECSVEGYIRALQRGCRCIECKFPLNGVNDQLTSLLVDCFDGPNGQPSIYHKNSLTNRILFRDVVDVISRYAFVASSYPLILSLETHCSVEQQAVMARILVEVLGDALVCEPISSSGKSHRLPSPAELMGRILVKGKVKPMSPDFVRMMSSDEIDDESEDDVTSSGINSSISSATGSPGRSVFYSTAEVTPLQLDDPSTHPPPVFDPVRRIGSEESFVARFVSFEFVNVE
ncbi:hypothetical protein BCR33DRAFT_738477 [Rhizoclosmatium globosum]|uniref:Phosphoinositide phospholipase C n=1 Tax=Rhizoclosmatium globosum TaxID=329046 RepID=A0A1Y2C9M8_9FUNG|nr:hypothetical protein BCR33DRAFT_738477 [Rhizoclosmatium globosum]|eukprot:ORY43743.1 hypothetical protein BCR33DRAFT_738477 [Rhizoclosmatium globosum]